MTRIHPRQVEAFRAVMMTGGVTSAAEFLNVTQPAVSRLLKDFEAALALTLFIREGGRLAPREEAVSLYREVERIYVGLEHIAQIADNIRLQKGGVLRIGAVPTLSEICVDDVIPKYTALRPNASLIFETESTEHILDLTALRQYDIGFVFGHFDQKGLSAQTLAEGSAVAVMSAEHPLASQSECSIEDIARYRVIAPGRKTPLRIALDHLFAAMGTSFNRPIQASLHNCVKLAAAGVGIGLADTLTALSYREKAVIKPVVPHIPVHYSVVMPPQTPKNVIVEEFHELLREAVAVKLASKP